MSKRELKKFLIENEKGFKSYETRCFRFIPQQMTWDDAKTNCKQWNAYLTSITDKFEQSWLTQTQSSQELKWIGLTDSTKPGTYTWANNETVSFSNWDKNKPGLIFFVYFWL